MAKVCFDGARHFLPDRLKCESSVSLASSTAVAGRSGQVVPVQRSQTAGTSRRPSISSLRKVR